MNHIPQRQEWTCEWVLDIQVLLSFLSSGVCKWPVINVTLLALKYQHKIQD